MRQLLSVLVPLLLPTAAYVLYVHVMRKRSAAGTGPEWRDVPWTWLAVAGGLLAAVALAAYTLLGGADPSATYKPPRLIDGKIEPGEFE
jgi:hypothetical protein